MAAPRPRSHVEIPADLADALRRRAVEYGVPMTWMAERLLREGLADMVPAAEFHLTVASPPPGTCECGAPLGH